MKRLSFLFLSLLVLTLVSCGKKEADTTENIQADTVQSIREAWSEQQANEWYKQWGWLRGSDFIPSTAINQLEMWQGETFDTATINRELGWAESIGLNSMRVYLHHAAWEIDHEGFKNRVNQYLTIADR
ncbi:MAG TPA: 1,4-beta-xylanase, partial [Cyclobacteriaceae bacterium]|nr:1,4-beta-xylanase [Cyclobacteriaceae bacterium]